LAGEIVRRAEQHAVARGHDGPWRRVRDVARQRAVATRAAEGPELAHGSCAARARSASPRAVALVELAALRATARYVVDIVERVQQLVRLVIVYGVVLGHAGQAAPDCAPAFQGLRACQQHSRCWPTALAGHTESA